MTRLSNLPKETTTEDIISRQLEPGARRGVVVEVDDSGGRRRTGDAD